MDSPIIAMQAEADLRKRIQRLRDANYDSDDSRYALAVLADFLDNASRQYQNIMELQGKSANGLTTEVASDCADILEVLLDKRSSRTIDGN